MKRLFRFLSFVLMIAVLISSFISISAFADYNTVTVTVNKGDTVYGICNNLGLDYYRCKDTIASLNGFSGESQLNKVKAGDSLVFPSCNVSPKKAEVPADDAILYYLMPYLIKEGDYLYEIYNLWGMDYDDYSEDILYMNYIPDPDKIPIGKLLWLPTNAENLMGKDYTTVVGHVMKKGETVYTVCQSYGMDYFEIEDHLEEFNCGKDLTMIQAGQVLKIPLS